MSDKKEYRSPAVTTDVVLFSLSGQTLKVLLIQRGNPPFQGQWAFPGGFLDYGEEPMAGALRELKEETGITDVVIEQFGAFGNPNRDPRGHTISIAYYGFIEDSRSSATGGDDATDAQWFDATDLPQLAFDHSLVFSTAIQTLEQNLRNGERVFKVLPDYFTMTDLKIVFGIISKLTGGIVTDSR